MVEYSNTVGVRIYIHEDEILHRDVFCYEIEPMCAESQSHHEWVAMHIDDFDASSYRDLLETELKSFQAIFTCRLRHWISSMTNEYDEVLEIVNPELIKIEPIPESYLEFIKGSDYGPG